MAYLVLTLPMSWSPVARPVQSHGAMGTARPQLAASGVCRGLSPPRTEAVPSSPWPRSTRTLTWGPLLCPGTLSVGWPLSCSHTVPQDVAGQGVEGSAMATDLSGPEGRGWRATARPRGALLPLGSAGPGEKGRSWSRWQPHPQAPSCWHPRRRLRGQTPGLRPPDHRHQAGALPLSTPAAPTTASANAPAEIPPPVSIVAKSRLVLLDIPSCPLC